MRQITLAFRALIRSKGYAFVTVATLAIAIGANTAMFSLLYAALLRELPYPQASQLVEIGRAAGPRVDSVTYPDYERWRDGSRSFTSLAVYFQNTGVSRVTLTSGDEPQAVQAAFVSASFFPLMGVAPRLGRVFTTSEERAGDPVVVLSDSMWRTQLAGSEAINGRQVRINGLPYRVIGVMPPSFSWPSRKMQMWIPITCNREWARRAGPVPFFHVLGRLAPGITRATAQDELRTLFNNPGETAAVPLRPPLAGDQERGLYLLLGAVGFVLLVACANIASLTLARGSKRASELALRVALGASRTRVATELFLESLVLAALGGAAGVFLASLFIDFLVQLEPARIEGLDQAGLDISVLLFSLAVSTGAALLFGLLPAWRLSALDPMDALRGLARGSSGGARTVRLRRWLVAGEVAIAVVLLAGAGVLLRSLHAAQRVDLGFDARNAFMFRVQFPDPTPEQRQIDYFRELFSRLGTVPGVQAVGAIRDLFENGTANTLGLREIEGRAPEPRNTWTPLTWTAVGGSYFEAMGAQLLAGRWFNHNDGPGAPLAAIIDEGAARRYWPGENPIGRRFKGQDPRGNNDEWLTVVGVVRTMRRQRVDRQPTAHIFEWYRQAATTPRDVVVRTAAPIAADLRAVARQLDPTVILSPVRTVQSEIDDQLVTRRSQTTLVAVFAALAFLLAATGIFGVAAYSVSLRLREFGIRTALGEPKSWLCARVLREALITALAGIIPGLCGAMALARLLQSVAFGVSALDPLSLAAACLLLGLMAMTAAAIPALRATAVDPGTVLRDQ
ncbi:MAG: ABC transporter permease [Bryobacterales bacterium]|nr:ABC transporter permease [Bryobacterales bacterium]